MKKNLIAAIVLMCVGLATFAGGKRDKNQNSIKQNDQYCYAGQTTCGTTYMTCSDIVLSAEDQLLVNDMQSFVDCGTPIPGNTP